MVHEREQTLREQLLPILVTGPAKHERTGNFQMGIREFFKPNREI